MAKPDPTPEELLRKNVDLLERDKQFFVANAIRADARVADLRLALEAVKRALLSDSPGTALEVVQKALEEVQ